MRFGAAERDLRARVAADAVLAAEIGDPWTEIAAIDEEQRRLFYPYRFLEFEAGGYSELFDAARTLVRSAEERAKPEGQRLPGYSNADLEQTAEQLVKQTPIEPAIEEIALAFWLSKAREFLTADDPQVKLLLGRESPEGLAHRLVSGTRLGDAAERRRLYEGGSAAIAQSDDPLIVFARQFDAQARALGKAYRETVREPKDAALERIARARFRLYGETVYPDATDTLRLNYGAVQGWTDRTAARSRRSPSLAGCSSAPPAPIRSSSRRYGRRRKASSIPAPSLTLRQATIRSAAIPDRR